VSLSLKDKGRRIKDEQKNVSVSRRRDVFVIVGRRRAVAVTCNCDGRNVSVFGQPPSCEPDLLAGA